MLYIYYIHFKITGNPCNLTCSQWCNLFKESIMFCSKLHLFPSQWGHLNKMPQSIVWRNQSNCTKMKKKRIETFYKPAHYRINNTFAQTTKSFIWVTELCDFKALKWHLKIAVFKSVPTQAFCFKNMTLASCYVPLALLLEDFIKMQWVKLTWTLLWSKSFWVQKKRDCKFRSAKKAW